jgi:hypothetical protein
MTHHCVQRQERRVAGNHIAYVIARFLESYIREGAHCLVYDTDDIYCGYCIEAFDSTLLGFEDSVGNPLVLRSLKRQVHHRLLLSDEDTVRSIICLCHHISP